MIRRVRFSIRDKMRRIRWMNLFLSHLIIIIIIYMGFYTEVLSILVYYITHAK